jgi:hypothetical protein
MECLRLFVEGENMVSNNIMIQDEGEGYIFYKASCACGDDDCNMTLWLDYHEMSKGEFKEIELHLFGRVGVYHPGFWQKIKLIWKLLIQGYVGAEKVFIFHGEKALADYIKALEEGLKKVSTGKVMGSK